MIRPAELAAIKAGTLDLAFRRWAKPRVVVGTRMRTGVGVIEVTSLVQVTVSSLRADDARRARYWRWIARLRHDPLFKRMFDGRHLCDKVSGIDQGLRS